MKKIIVSFLLAVSVATVTTGCSFTRYMEKVEEAKERQAEEEKKQQEKEAEEKKAEEEKEKKAEEEKDKQDEEETNNSSNATSNSDDNNSNGTDEEFSFAIDLDSADPYGNRVMTEDMVSGASVVMINFWEPWCGPCVGELHDLELIYENYKDSGLVIIGAYTTYDMPDDVIALIEENNISYPIIYATEDTYRYMSEYVPTTCFFDSYGNPLDNGSYIGAHSYDDWSSIVEQALESVN